MANTSDPEVARSLAGLAEARSAESHQRGARLPAAQAQAGSVRLPGTSGQVVERANAVAESAERWVVEVELAVAAAHQRAAEVYESWLQHRVSAFSREELAQRAQAHRDKLAASRSVDRLGERTLAKTIGGWLGRRRGGWLRAWSCSRRSPV